LLLSRYFENNHPHFSLLDTNVLPDDYYSRSKLLFWVIISIASQRYEDDPTLLGMLSQPVQNLLWDTIRILPHSPFMVEAIVLSSMWPLPTSSMWNDPSFMLISMAKSSVMQLGLHRPEHIQDFSRVEKKLDLAGVQDSVRIWAACYIAAQWFVAL
jgi:transcriptional regulatory protein LEU3